MTASTVVDAKKATIPGKQALAMVSEIDEIFAAKGKKVVHLDLRKAKPSQAELESVLLGPTGNLRAPAIRIGRTLVVGFDESAYERVLK